ncbi:MAG: B12-binding domain-containing radical SAM protein [Candidatus Odinarchaeia archaeon]
MKVCLVYLPFYEYGGGFAFRETVPLGIGYIAAFAKAKNIDVEVLNTKRAGIKAVHRKITQYDPDIVGFSTYVWNVKDILELAKLVKRDCEKTLTVLGGPQVSFIPERFLEKPFIDLIVQGEGEIPFLKIIEAIKEKRDFRNIPGVAFKDCGKIISSTPYICQDLDSLPSPYLSEVFSLEGYCEFAVQTSRGCPFGCIYCMWGKYGRGVRFFPIKRVLEELKYIYNMGAKSIQFADAEFNISEERAVKICNNMKDEGIIFDYATYEIRGDHLTDRLAKAIKETAKSVLLGIGLESADPKVLSSIGKQLDLEKFKHGIEIAKKYGLLVQVNIMVGLPYQTETTFKKTIEFVEDIKPDRVVINGLKVLPGTKIYMNPSEFNVRIISDDHGIVEHETEYLSAQDIIDLQRYAYKELSAEALTFSFGEKLLMSAHSLWEAYS